MNKHEKIYIYKICKKVRKESIKYYKSYSLAYQCYYVSKALQKELYKHNIPTILTCGSFDYYYGHTWLEYKNNIIDLTARQFNTFKDKNWKFPSILIKEKSKLKMFTN